MILRSKLIGNSTVYLAGNILNAGIPFLLMPILTRVLTPADYGLVAMFGLVIAVMSALAGLSVHGVVSVRYFQLEKLAMAGYVGTCIGILIISTGISLLLVTIFGDVLSMVSGIPKEWLLIATFIAGLQFLSNIRLALWQVTGQAIKYATFQVGQSFLNAIFSLALVLLVGMAWEGRVLGQSAVVAIFGLMSLFFLIRDKQVALPTNWKIEAVDALRYGVPLLPHTIGGVVMVMGDRFIIESQLGASDVGIYMAAVQMSLGLTLVYDALFKSWHPEIMKLAAVPEGGAQSTVLVIKIYKLIGICFCVMLGYWILAWGAYPFVVGQSFLDGQKLIIFMAISAFFSSCYYATAIFISVANRNELLAINTFISGAVSLVASYFLCISFGLVGVAIGLLIGQFLSFILCWYSANLVYPLPWIKVFR
ncbi:MAG: oligosaccharide flippase family protein [Gallionellaceae bacterium]